MEPMVVTSYTDPDLDGFASAIAYSEFLNKTGVPAVFRIFGTPHSEASYLVAKYGFDIKSDDTLPLDRVALVDASELRDLDRFIRPENVVEVIDHRGFNDAASFKNASVRIEPVGAAATLIAEKFASAGCPISLEARTLLYGAIISNTLNFKAAVTTERDRRMAAWLNSGLGFGEDFVEEMFLAKSDMSGDKLKDRIQADFAWFELGTRRIGIAQLELVAVDKLLETRLPEIALILNEQKACDKLDSVFISLIDLVGGFNAFFTDDPRMQEILKEVLGIEFDAGLAFRRHALIMRKEIVPLLEQKLRQSS